MKKPNFLIVGAAKCGTSSFAAYLSQHPNIYICPEKECHYFSNLIYQDSEGRPWNEYIKSKYVKDFDGYLSRHFSSVEDQDIIGEASTEYLYFNDIAIPKIKEMLGEDVKILIILRNPVQASFSRYKHSVRRGWETEGFAKAVDLWDERRAKGYIWDFDYIDAFKYSSQVEAYLLNFKNVKVILLEEFIRNREEVFKETCDYLGIDPYKPSNLYEEYNSSINTELPLWLQKLSSNNVQKSMKILLPATIHNIIVEWLRKKVKDKARHVPTITKDMERNLKIIFQQDIQKLERILCTEMISWK